MEMPDEALPPDRPALFEQIQSGMSSATEADVSLHSLPSEWWKCLRNGPVSGRYRGEMTGPRPGSHELDLRVDIDPRYDNSPVMERISGDLYLVFRFRFFGRTFEWRVYRESWMVDDLEITWSRCAVEIEGQVQWWKGIHPRTGLKVRIPWTTSRPPGPAEVIFSQPDGTEQTYSCKRASRHFRDLNLEVDVVQSASDGRLLPEYDTHTHNIRPAGLPQRLLTVEEAYREAGADLTIRADRTIIDDSHEEFASWSPAELHDAMETHFSQIGKSWPRWEMWGLLAGQFDNPGVGGIMFDAAAIYGGAGEPPERQGFAVFRNHSWYRNLPAGTPATQAEAAALRKFLYTWVHEAGHAFNFLHSWNKNRPDALSWMNYDWRYDNRNGAGSFWSNFEFRFDDEELIHLRHGDRASVIMGGDPWASGGHIEAPPGAEHLEAPPGALSQAEGNMPLELLVRSKGYYHFMEPVEVELRLRNLLPDMALEADIQLDPAFGGVTLFIKRPDGRIIEYDPIMCKLAEPHLQRLEAADKSVPGADRHSQSIFLSYSTYGWIFNVPGEYLIRALYQGAGDLLIPSNMHRVRVGNPMTREEDRLAQDYFTYPVGMSLYLRGSQSPHLKKGMETLREVADRFDDSLVGAKAAEVVAEAVARPFFRVEAKEGRRLLQKTHEAKPEEALQLTAQVMETYRRAQGKEARALNLAYHTLARQRAQYRKKLGKRDEAREELRAVRDDLEKRGVNRPVLEDLESFTAGL